jgi:hypothetical protein
MLLLLQIPAMAQDPAKPKPSAWGIRFTGFIKNDIWYDTRQVFASRDDLFLFYPLNKLPDRDGNDINANPSFNFTALATRLTAKISMPDALGAKLDAVIEGDFSGVSNADVNGLRMRHAYGRMTWKHAELLIGQYWHPLFTTEVAPTVASLNTGAPFQPFCRNPQLSISGIFGKFRISGAFVTQRDNANDGPDGACGLYIRNAIMPNVDLQLQYKNDHHVVGLGVDYKYIRPRLVNNDRISHAVVNSWAGVAYYKMTYGKFGFKLKGIMGQNLSECSMLGGYALRTNDTAERVNLYTPTNHLSAWTQFCYGKKYQAYLFAGYSKNLGTTHTNVGLYYGRGKDIAWLYRITPGVSCLFEKFQVTFEAEYTVAAYGTPDNHGFVKDPKAVADLRPLLVLLYHF